MALLAPVSVTECTRSPSPESFERSRISVGARHESHLKPTVNVTKEFFVPSTIGCLFVASQLHLHCRKSGIPLLNQFVLLIHVNCAATYFGD